LRWGGRSGPPGGEKGDPTFARTLSELGLTQKRGRIARTMDTYMDTNEKKATD
jgi:hypothetical protein